MSDFDGVITGAPEWSDVPSLSANAVALGGASGAGAMNAQAASISKRLNYLLSYTFPLDAASGYATLGASNPRAKVHVNDVAADVLLTTPSSPSNGTLLGRVSFGSYAYLNGSAYKAALEVGAAGPWTSSGTPIEFKFISSPGAPTDAPAKVASIDTQGNSVFGQSYTADISDTKSDRRVTVYASGSQATDANLYLQNAASGTSQVDGLKLGLTGVDSTLMNNEAGLLRIGTNKTNLISMTPAGRVGIKNDSPSATLDVNGDIRAASDVGLTIGSSATATMRIDASAFYVGLTNRNFDVRTGAGADATVRVNGTKVGINMNGTTLPRVSLDVNATDAFHIPSGTTAQRNSNAIPGDIRHNLDTDKPEYFGSLGWRSLVQAGVTGGGTNQVFFENDNTVTDSYTIPAGRNSGTWGPISIADGVTVTVSDGATWTII